MCHDIIKQQLISNKLFENGEYNCRYWKTKENKTLKEKINLLRIEGFNTFQEKIWSLLNNVSIRPVCEVCGNNVNFKSMKDGFRKTCSIKCGTNHPECKDKIKQTSIEKYGVEHPTKSLHFKNTIQANKEKYGFHPGSFNTPKNKLAIKEKYGVENVGQSREIKEKIKKTNNKRYGVDNPQQNKSIREKTKNTNIKKYGQDGWNPIQVKKTLLAKYGVDNPLKSEEIKEKIKATCLDRYNVEHPMHDKMIFEKCQKNQVQARYKFKEMTLPSGNKLFYQGYEGYVIDYLIKCGVSENDIENDRFKIPSIYYEFENRKRRYFPDIFIKSKNMLIEVKSTYTFLKDAEKNLEKQRACKLLGFHHIIIIWDEKLNSIYQII